MSYRPRSPGKAERTGSSRDRQYALSTDLDTDTPFVPNPEFPCYEPTVCAPDLDDNRVFPAFVIDDLGAQVETDFGDVVIASNK